MLKSPAAYTTGLFVWIWLLFRYLQAHRHILFPRQLYSELSFMNSSICNSHFPGIDYFHLILCSIIKVEVSEARSHEGIIVNKIIFPCRETGSTAGNLIPFAGIGSTPSPGVSSMIFARNLIRSGEVPWRTPPWDHQRIRIRAEIGFTVSRISSAAECSQNLLVISSPLIFPQPNWMLPS